MNVGELKQLLQGVPDHYDVTLGVNNGGEAFWRRLDEKRWESLRGSIVNWLEPVPKDYRDDRLLHTWASSGRVVMWKGKHFGEFRISNGEDCPSLGGKYMQPEEEPASRILPGETQLQLPAGQGIERRRR